MLTSASMRDDFTSGTSDAQQAPTAPSATAAGVLPAREASPSQDEGGEFDVTDEPSTGYDTSITSSVYECTYERGRRYQCFKNGLSFPIPNDEQEQDREDMKHAMLMELTDGALFFAPVGDKPQSILDVGTGTGIWAIEVGDRYPSARVCGIDLTPIQPVWVPPNVEFLVDDCEQDWLMRDIDLVHFRFMALILKNLDVVLSHALRSLRPGGWIEFQELHGRPYCDDGTMKDDDGFARLYALAGEAYRKFGMQIMVAPQLGAHLRDAGFVNIQRRMFKVPIGGWPGDERMRTIGEYQKLAVLEFISTLAGRPFQALGVSSAEAQVTLAMARNALDDGGAAHRYFEYYFWSAQKPT